MKLRNRHRTSLILDTRTETDRAETDASIHHVTLQGVLYDEKNALRREHRRKLTNNVVGG